MDWTLSPTPTPADAAAIARDLYGIEAEVHFLPGEYDANFRLEMPSGGRLLLKIARAGDTRETIEVQNAILEHLAVLMPDLAVQRTLPTRRGAAIGETVDGASRQRFVRLLTYLPGRTLARVRPHTPALLRSLGAVLGRMDAALVSFVHPLATRPLKWDLSQAEWIREHLDAVAGEPRRDIVRRHLDRYLGEVQPRLAGLRRSVVHNDANDHNILVEGTGWDARVSGLLDFGDALLTPTVCNLAIALAYVMLGKPDPVASACHVVAGYHAAYALDEDELAVLFPLALMRLAVSVTNSARRKIAAPEDPYVTISEAPAWAALEKLEAVHARLAHYRFRNAAGLDPVPSSPAVSAWLKSSAAEIASPVAVDPRRDRVLVYDLSVGSLELGLPDEFDTTEK